MTDIRGLKPLVDLTPEAFGIFLLLLALAFVASWFLAGRNTLEANPSHRHPKKNLSIRQRLDLLRAKEKLAPEAFCAGLSEIMRDFLKSRYGLLCRRLTTTEILQEIEKKGIPEQISALLSEILQTCDLVKFASLSPDALELQQQITSAYLILEYSRERGNP